MKVSERYQLRRLIARGGAAEVFEAVEELGSGRRRAVAIKRLLARHRDDSSFARGFRDEARILANLAQANIVRFHDFGIADGQLFQVLELVQGADLESIAVRAEVPAVIALFVVRQVCRALDYAHGAGVIHRDVTPENILISWTGDVKLADFGIAWAADREEQTAAGVAKGKLEYMAPELLRGEPADTSADIFALGRVLQRLVEGSGAIPDDIREVIASATHADRASRIGSAAELEARINNVLAVRGGRDAVALRGQLEAWLDALEATAETDPVAASPAAAAHGARDLLDLELVLERHDAAGIARFVSRPSGALAEREAREAPEVGEFLDDYEIVAVIGRGSTATVFRASHPEHGDGLALKVLHAKLTHVPRLVRRFLREARTLKSVVHPNVVRVIEAGEAGGFLFIVTELVEGRALSRVIAQGGPLDAERATAIVRQIARGLAAVHARGIVHRDLKPANVMVAGAEVKLLDFGIAKSVATAAQDTRLTRGGVLGTPAFMSPEQFADPAGVGPATDMFALGRIIVEMQAGPRLDALAGDLLAPDPSARLTAEDLLARLEDEQRPTQILPPPPPLPRADFFRPAMILLPSAALIATVALVVSIDRPPPPSRPSPEAPRNPRREPPAILQRPTPLDPQAVPTAAPQRDSEAAPQPDPQRDSAADPQRNPQRDPTAEPQGEPHRDPQRERNERSSFAAIATAVLAELRAHGLELDDLDAHDATRPWHTRWRSAAAARDARAAAALQAELGPLIQTYPIDATLVLTRLDSLRTAIRSQSPKLPPRELDALEARYFALRSALAPDTPRARCEELLRAAADLRRDLY